MRPLCLLLSLLFVTLTPRLYVATATTDTSDESSNDNVEESEESEEGEEEEEEEEWYDETAEADFLEAMCMCILIVIEMVLEECWSRVTDRTSETYKYGAVHMAWLREHDECDLDEDASLTSAPLMPGRPSGELLAFILFNASHSGFFDVMAEEVGSPDSIPMPTTGEGLYEVVEYVHMHLFLTVMFYFICAALWLSGIRNYTQRLEMYQMLYARSIREKRPPEDVGAEDIMETPSALDVECEKGMKYYVQCRVDFIDSIQAWRERQPRLYEMVVASCGATQAPSEEERDELVRVCLSHFEFSAYFALALEEDCVSLITIRPITWFSMFITLFILCVCHYNTSITNYEFMPFYACHLVISTSIVVLLAGRVFLHTPKDHESLAVAVHPKRFKRSGWMKAALMTYIQLSFVHVCYSLSRSLVNTHAWSAHRLMQISVVCVYAGLLIVCTWTLSRLLPAALAMLALAPNMGESNVETLITLLDQERSVRAGRKLNHHIDDIVPQKIVRLLAKSKSTLNVVECEEGLRHRSPRDAARADGTAPTSDVLSRSGVAPVTIEATTAAQVPWQSDKILAQSEQVPSGWSEDDLASL
eukprot:NODE_3574_length_2016_cov_14.924828.p1 GENE.NODE_3574_length_2016_cov_14.924828~~NODE_3574_length_2016_cov_14.924828.p1  ORF type:complete len:589 (-),score=110.44 NODE_3574_length_2016_cov_14.924828:165-1931(-)